MNKYQEALYSILKSNPKVNLTTSDIHKDIRLLQELVDKETPMKRKNIVDKTLLNSYFICPKCKIKVSQMELYCYGCGQRLE